MASNKNDEIMDEEQIVNDLGTLYDQTKKFEGYKDEDSQPYRYLSNWKYIANTRSNRRSKSSNNSEVYSPLPSNNIFSSNGEIYGLLEGVVNNEDGNDNNDDKKQEVVVDSCLPKVQVRLTKLKTWCVDRSESTRGIWVETSLAWYKLKQPCTEIDTNGQSQEIIHLPMRAKFGLVSNIVDLLSETYSDVKSTYVAIHAKRTPTAIYKLLSPSPSLLEQYQTPPDILYPYPFDLSLLKQNPRFIHQHLTNFHPLLTHDCVFMQNLNDMEKEYADSKEYTTTEYLQSAKDAEIRGNRLPWGDWIVGNSIVKVSPNRLIDIEIRAAQRAAAQAAATTSSINNHNSNAAVVVDNNDDNDTTSNGEKSKKKKILSSFSKQKQQQQSKPKLEKPRRTSSSSPSITTDVTPNITPVLNVIQTPKLSYSQEAMDEAKRELQPYLATTTKTTSTYLPLSEENFNLLKKNVILSTNILNLEVMLHVIESLRISSKKVLKLVFIKRDPLCGKNIFETWLDHCLLIITNQIKSGLINEKKKGKDPVFGTEEMIIESIMKLICDYSVISTEKQLNVLRDKFDVDWVTIVEKALSFSNEHKIRNLITPCIAARNHLLCMKRGTSSKATTKNSSSSQTPDVKKTSLSSPTPITNVKKGDVITIEDNVEDENKRKKKEQELRRKRMMELMKQAKGSSHRAGIETNNALNDQYNNGKHSPMQPMEPDYGANNRFGSSISGGGGYNSHARESSHGKEEKGGGSAWNGTSQNSWNKGKNGIGKVSPNSSPYQDHEQPTAKERSIPDNKPDSFSSSVGTKKSTSAWGKANDNTSSSAWSGNTGSSSWSSPAPTTSTSQSSTTREKDVSTGNSGHGVGHQESNSKKSGAWALPSTTLPVKLPSLAPEKDINQGSSNSSSKQQQQCWSSSSTGPERSPNVPSQQKVSPWNQADDTTANISDDIKKTSSTSEDITMRENAKEDNAIKSASDSAWGSAKTKPVSSGWGASSSSSSWGAKKAVARDSKEPIKDSSSVERTMSYGNKDSQKDSFSRSSDRIDSHDKREPSKDSTNRRSDRTNSHENKEPSRDSSSRINDRAPYQDYEKSSKDSFGRSNDRATYNDNKEPTKDSASWNSGRPTSYGNKDSSNDSTSWSNGRATSQDNKVSSMDSTSWSSGRAAASQDNREPSKHSSSWSSGRVTSHDSTKVNTSWSSDRATSRDSKTSSRDWNHRDSSHEAKAPYVDTDASKQTSVQNGENVASKSSWSSASNGTDQSNPRNLNRNEATAEKRKTSQSFYENKPEITTFNNNAPIVNAAKSWGVAAPQSSSSSWGSKSKTNSYSMESDAKPKDSASWKRDSSTSIAPISADDHKQSMNSKRVESNAPNHQANADKYGKASAAGNSGSRNQTSWGQSSTTLVTESKEQQSRPNHSTDYKQEPSKQSSGGGWNSSNSSSTWTKSSTKSSQWSSGKKSASSTWSSSNPSSSHKNKSNFKPRQQEVQKEEDEDGEIVDNSGAENKSKLPVNNTDSYFKHQSSREEVRKRITEKQNVSHVKNVVNDITATVVPVGRGRGRGRGRGINLPAWMTSGNQPSSSTNSLTKEEPKMVPNSQRLSPKQASGNNEFGVKNSGWKQPDAGRRAVPDASGKKRSRAHEHSEIGRGRGRANRGEENDSKHTKLEHNEKGFGRGPVRNVAADKSEAVAPAGRGRGRGRNLTLPAWMTKK